MKRIYSAANLPEAYLVRDLLAHEGIAAHIFNENAIGALGDLPMAAAAPQVWITQQHQEQHARAIIARFELRVPDNASQQCSACNETNPGGFELCWNCNAALLGAPAGT